MFEYFQIEAGKFSRGADYFEILMEYCEIVIDYFIKVVPLILKKLTLNCCIVALQQYNIPDDAKLLQ